MNYTLETKRVAETLRNRNVCHEFPEYFGQDLAVCNPIDREPRPYCYVNDRWPLFERTGWSACTSTGLLSKCLASLKGSPNW